MRPSNHDDDPVVLLQVTDSHLHANAASRMRGVNTYETFLAVLEAVKRSPRWPPDAIIATGDLVQDESRQGYVRFRSCLESLTLPIFCIPGNHDDPSIMADVLDTPPFQYCGRARLGGWHIIFLNSFAAGEDSGSIGSEGLAELEAALAAAPDPPTMICLHHQPIAMGSGWLDGVGLKDADRLLEITDRHAQIRALVWGHVHQASDRMRGDIRLLSTPSTCAQFLPHSEFFALDDSPPGCRWIELYPDGRIETTVDWIESADAAR